MSSVYAVSSVLSSIISWLIANVTIVLQLVGLWFVFRKMGLPGWKGIIPYYGDYVLFDKLWETKKVWRMIIYSAVFAGTFIFGYIFIFMGIMFAASGSDPTVAVAIVFIILGAASLIASIVMVVLAIVINFQLYKKLAHAFGLKDAWAWGLLFLPYVFLPIIGFHRNIIYYGPVNQV